MFQWTYTQCLTLLCLIVGDHFFENSITMETNYANYWKICKNYVICVVFIFYFSREQIQMGDKMIFNFSNTELFLILMIPLTYSMKFISKHEYLKKNKKSFFLSYVNTKWKIILGLIKSRRRWKCNKNAVIKLRISLFRSFSHTFPCKNSEPPLTAFPILVNREQWTLYLCLSYRLIDE